MRRTIQVRFFRGDRKCVAERLDLPVVTEGDTQGDTLDELASNVREAIGLHVYRHAFVAPRPPQCLIELSSTCRSLIPR
jgi:hypothetical protein